jgi:hypothetical protein
MSSVTSFLLGLEFGEEEAKAIAKAIQKNTTVKSLNLSGTRFGSHSDRS